MSRIGGDDLPAAQLLGTRIHTIDYVACAHLVQRWAQAGETRVCCLANVHLVMEAWDDPGYRAAINAADLVAPDGMPLVWMLRAQGHLLRDRVYGPALMLQLLAEASQSGIPVGFLGGRPTVLRAMLGRLRRSCPELRIAFHHSPPFRPLHPHEDRALVARINASGCRVLFVGLGCPKQERWMAAHARGTRQVVGCVMIGVGAAFDFTAGTLPQAPGWMQRRGLEWLFRLTCEPRRLWWRYLKHNPRFALLALREVLCNSGRRSVP
jgi:N-acetylglucosaminyldiphosphoundecaprenol N-acetyl-beta-D-mannosaminyltransferase